MKTKNVFFPFKGINNIAFGMTRNEVRELLNAPFKTFKRGGEFAKNTTDYYHSDGFFAIYNENDFLDAIELDDTSNLFYDDVDLIDVNFADLKERFDKLSRNNDDDKHSIIYYDLGLGIGRNVESKKIESLIIFSKQYWIK